LEQAGKLILPPQDEPECRSALHLYPVRLGPKAGKTRREAFDALRAAGIGVNVHYIPIYFHPYYRGLGFERGLCPNAEAYYERAVSIPMHAGLSAADLDHVVRSLTSAVG
jgi:dTDP-4-amino-4,6-dideoxygalactose transaminase